MQCPVSHESKNGVPTPLPAGHPEMSPNGPDDAPVSGAASPQVEPDFVPNAPASVVPSEYVTLKALLYESGAGDDANAASVDEWPLPDDLDLSRPAAELMREGTQRAHVAAEHSDGAVALTAGRLELKEYVRWLAILWRIYDALEDGLSAHSSNSVLSPTYNPALLARAPELAKDIEFLLPRIPSSLTAPSEKPLVNTASTPLPPFPLPSFLEKVFTEPSAPLDAYLSRIRELSSSSEGASRLLAHAYVRYLGDLSGGQVIGARLRKAYGLEGLDGRRFYYFDLLSDSSAAESGEETVGERKKKLNEVKNWYRSGMNEGAGDDEALKASLVREANVAFLLNTHLFSLITPPKAKEPELRYYEKQELERKRQLELNPPRKTTWRDVLNHVVFFVCAIVIGMFLTQAVAPKAARYAFPYYRHYVGPFVDNKLAPWWNDHAWPVLQRHMRQQRNSLF